MSDAAAACLGSLATDMEEKQSELETESK